MRAQTWAAPPGLEILYQPQFRCSDNLLVGAEALARWRDPHLGRLGARALFERDERIGDERALWRRIAQAALGGAVDWPPELRLSLNVTAADLALPHFAERVMLCTDRTGFSPERLTLEITEDALLSDVRATADELARLVERGVQIALDDFGAGFCNFGYLKLLPLHYLKLDRSMVEGIGDDERDLAVLRGIMAMAQALDLSVIAEGIESEAQRDAVAREGCAVWQGFLGAAPMTAAAFEELSARED